MEHKHESISETVQRMIRESSPSSPRQAAATLNEAVSDPPRMLITPANYRASIETVIEEVTAIVNDMNSDIKNLDKWIKQHIHDQPDTMLGKWEDYRESMNAWKHDGEMVLESLKEFKRFKFDRLYR